MNKEIYELLKDKKRLKEQKLFIVDTEKILKEVLENNLEIKYFLYSENAKDIIELLPHNKKKNALKIKESYINKFSVVDSHQGFLAVVKEGDNEIGDFEKIDKLVLLDTIQEPSNLGAIIRSGIAFGFENFLLINCAYLYNEKVIRASAGAVFQCKYREIKYDEIDRLKEKYQIITTSSKDGLNLKKVKEKLKNKFILVLGNEGRGINSSIEEKSDLKICIELKKRIESLNVAVAAAIIFYELTS